MTRIDLGGKGDPIPILALPDPSLLGKLPSTVIEFKDGDVFDKQWWTNLGFTHFEVWCVGAAGGRGGSHGRPQWITMYSLPDAYPSMPLDVWEAFKELTVLNWESGLKFETYDGVWWHENGHMIETPGWYPGRPDLFPYGETDWWIHWADRLFPNRDPERAITFKVDPVLDEQFDNEPAHPPTPYVPPVRFGLGGAGGGGGTHVVSGELSALPDFSPIVVGAAGKDSGPGQQRVNGVWTPPKTDRTGDLDTLWGTGYYRRLVEVSHIFARWQYRFVEPLPQFLPPQPGEDGGSSSFGGNICRASGGKGGRPTFIWEGGEKKLDGSGGEGGIGGQLLAGGGAAGSIDHNPGKEGTWVNGIGKGGGGGRGGAAQSTYGTEPTRDATSGGRGTMSYADTSVYGRGELWSYWVRVERAYDIYTGELDRVKSTVTESKYVPGGGGGVRALRKYPYGSKAPGYNPNGLVLMRLTKIS